MSHQRHSLNEPCEHTCILLCGYCTHVISVDGLLECEAFEQRLYINNDYEIKRCPQCLDAEKQYKEKGNEL